MPRPSGGWTPLARSLPLSREELAMTIAQPQTSERRIVEVGGRSIGVLNVHGQSYARRNRCPH
jgi:nitrite reductase/ring-hydroxylating ferredoxin subunit